MPLSPGQTISSYEVLAQLGAGGMGEVYKARDKELGREVAIKVLPDVMAKDAERVLRFRREAKLLAALNHPNIGAIHGFDSVQTDDLPGEDSRTHFLVLEYIEGQSLGKRLEKSPLFLEDALEVCKQVAEALEAAHDKGIIHRDLKPDNVHLKPDGTVKVLDFGLARAMTDDVSPVTSHASTAITTNYLRPGAVLGSVPYLSPEQLRSKPVDKRTDIWSFGCLLYECVTGKRSFQGETASDTIAQILEGEPDWNQLPRKTPAAVRRLMRRCLDKNPKKRLRDVGDARIELDEALRLPRQRGQVRRRRLPRQWLVATGSAAAGALVAWLVLGSTLENGPAVTRVSRLTFMSDYQNEWPTWGPEGNAVAFASNRNGNLDVFYRRLAGDEPVNVTRDTPSDDFQPSLSPDGEKIAFVSTRGASSDRVRVWGMTGFEFRTFGGDVYVTGQLGGNAEFLAPDGNSPVWHPGGHEIAYISGIEDHRSILRVDAGGGGTPKPVLPEDQSTWEIVRIQYVPGGEWISFETVDQEVYVLPVAGGTPGRLLQGSSHGWGTNDQRLYFLVRQPEGGTLLQMVDVDLGAVATSPARTIYVLAGVFRDLAVAPDEGQMVVSRLEESLNLTSLEMDPVTGLVAGPEQPLNVGQVIDRFPAFSPNGERIAFSSNRLRQHEIWVYDIAAKQLKAIQLPGDDLGTMIPFWRDNERLLVTRLHEERKMSLWEVWAPGTDGSPREVIPPKPGLFGGPVHEDKLLYSYRVDDYLQLFVRNLNDDSEPEQQLTTSDWDTYGGVWSPDGTSIIYFSNRSESIQVWLRDMGSPGIEDVALTDGSQRMRHAFFSSDGSHVYVQPDHGNIYRVRITDDGPGPLEQITFFEEAGLFLEEPMLSPNGRTLVYCKSQGGSSLLVLTLDQDR